jgi:two-component system phosphate regulon sensor histidine kinase PhoR
MRSASPLTLIPALLGAATAAGLSIALGSPAPAALPAGFLGGLAVWLFNRKTGGSAEPIIQSMEPFDALRGALEELLPAIDDPVLLVERQQVTMANGAALTLLGEYIINEDVRLAIRHPAASDRLIGRVVGDTRPIELVGLGEAERRWELVTHDIDGDRRIVRLSDRTSNYAVERMRVDFVANASHELRTPLATLLGFIETLQDGKAADDPATRTRFLNIMFAEARRMQRLVDDLISLSRIEAEKFSPPDTAVALMPLIAEVASSAETSAETDRGRIVRPPLALKADVLGDRAQLSQLLHNLVGNALKYSRAGTPVKITVEPQDAMIRIEVSDEGEGIAAEHLPRLTERFYRVDTGRSRAMGGTGLGLAIVKHIVERHRGRLDIRSETGVGTTVSVLLPAVPLPLS